MQNPSLRLYQHGSASGRPLMWPRGLPATPTHGQPPTEPHPPLPTPLRPSPLLRFPRPSGFYHVVSSVSHRKNGFSKTHLVSNIVIYRQHKTIRVLRLRHHVHKRYQHQHPAPHFMRVPGRGCARLSCNCGCVCACVRACVRVCRVACFCMRVCPVFVVMHQDYQF